MKVFRFMVAGALVLFAVTAGLAMSVKSDYEKSFDFGQLHTFAFKTDRASNDPLSTNTLEAGRIQNATGGEWLHPGHGESGFYCRVLLAHKGEDASPKYGRFWSGSRGRLWSLWVRPGIRLGLWHPRARALALGLWV